MRSDCSASTYHRGSNDGRRLINGNRGRRGKQQDDRASRGQRRGATRWPRRGQLTFAEVAEIVDETALGLVGLGIEPGDRVALLANTRPEWTFSSLAISRAGAVVVPIYPTNSPEECEWVAGNSDSRIVICEDAGQAAKIDKVRSGLPDLEHIILIDPDADSHPDGDGDGHIAIDALREQSRGGDRAELDRRCAAVAPGDPYTIIYTSGTTGASCSATATARRSA
jgi:long-chain acyl-CoA synthetase